MSGKREINGVFMIPFGLVAGFADGQEIRITELAEHGFCFRTLDEIREVKRFRICFYDGFNGMKTGDQEKKSSDPYTEVEIHSFEMEVRVEDGLGIPVYEYSVFVEQEKYRECAGKLILWYDRFVRLKLECEDGELAMALTGYPAKKDEQFAENFIEQKKEWFGEGEDRVRLEKRNTGSYCCGDFTESKRNDFEDRMTVEKRIENQSGIRETCIAAGDFERKGHKETAWKNIEVAVELDCPELYERYLSMKFRDFMDWYWNVNGAKELGKRMPVPDRIYVGNAFCHLLFPEKRQLFEIFKKAESEGLAVTVTFSYLREFMLKPVEKLLDELEEWCRNRETFLEIAANDWGLLELLRERKEWKEEKEVLVPCMGILLNKRKKDPRMGYKQGETGYFRENSLNAEFYRTYLRDTFGIRRYEWESCGYRQQFPEGKNSIHVPFYQTNTSQYCTLYAACKNGERGKQELPESCPGYCREKVFLYPKHLKMVGRYNSLFALDESTVSGMEDTEGWKEKRIDRIVVNLL